MIREEDVFCEKVVDFDQEMDESPQIENNPFVVSEAQESGDGSENYDYVSTTDGLETPIVNQRRFRRRHRDVRVIAS